MMDSSDGSRALLHQLAEASGVGFELDPDRSRSPAVDAVADDPAERFELAAHFGEDFELVYPPPTTRSSPSARRVRAG